MWKKKIKKKKTQYFIIGIMILVTIAIFSMCLSFTAEFSMFSQTILTEENSSDTYVIAQGSNKFIENLTSDDVKDNIESYNSYNGSTLSVPMKYKDKDITLLNQMMLYINDIKNTPEFKISEVSNDEKSPQKGEIWIPKILASPCGIKLGDKIVLDYNDPIELTVSGIYTAKVLITSNLAFGPVIVSEEDKNLFKDEKDASIFGVNLKDNTTESIEELRNDYKYGVLFVSRTDLITNFMSVAGSVGSFGIIAALVVFCVALAMIRYIVKVTIMNEYKYIGIYKSLGYTSKKITGFYLKGYMVVGLISAILGSFILLPVVKTLGINSSQNAEGFAITPVSYSMCILSILLFMLLLFISIRGALKPIRKLTAVEIMNIGMRLNAKRVTKSIIKNAKTPLEAAINDIFKHKIINSLIIVVFTLSTFLSLLFSTMAYSSYKMNDNANLWFAVPKNNTYAMGNINEDFINWLKDDERVESFIYGNLVYSTTLTSEDTNNSLNSITFNLYNDFSQEVTGVKINGKPPENNNEIVATSKALDLLDHSVGDTIHLEINGVNREYKITGTYDTLLSSIGIMMTTDAMKECNQNYLPYTSFITLKNESDFDNFSKDIEDMFNGITVESDWFAIDNAIQSTKTMLLGISGIMIFIFTVFAMLNILITLLIESSNKRREYGILKALGFTNSYITKQNIYKSMLCVSISTILALTLHLSISRRFLSMQVIDAFTNSNALMASLIILILLVTLLVTYLITLSVKKIMPTELMEE